MKKDKFTLKKVVVEQVEQYNQLLKYVFQVTKHVLQEVGWEEKEILRAKLPNFQQAQVLGWFDGEVILGSGVVSRASSAGLGWSSPFRCLFLCLASILFFYPPLFSCMVFGVCVETFIFQQLTLS